MPPRVAAAVEILDAKRVKHCYRWRFSFQKLLWRMGLDQPPHHFEGFWRSFISHALYFGSVWGLLMWALIWRWEGASPADVLLRAVIGGAFFGLAMAAYYRYLRRKHDLPAWSEIQVG
jgi:Family of unknown function (DUF6404)